MLVSNMTKIIFLLRKLLITISLVLRQARVNETVFKLLFFEIKCYNSQTFIKTTIISFQKAYKNVLENVEAFGSTQESFIKDSST